MGLFWADAGFGIHKANAAKPMTTQSINDRRIFFLLSKKAFTFRVYPACIFLSAPSFLLWLLARLPFLATPVLLKELRLNLGVPWHGPGLFYVLTLFPKKNPVKLFSGLACPGLFDSLFDSH
jgi:hypothetical protein